MDNQQNCGAASREWQNWCRLCAKRDGQSIDLFIEQTHLAFFIKEFFHIHITQDDELPPSLCAECYSVLSSLEKYAEHVNKVQEMYKDLKVHKNHAEIEIKDFYKKYDIQFKPLAPLLTPTTAKSTIGSVIEEVTLDCNDIKCLSVKEETTVILEETVNEPESALNLFDPLTNDTDMQEMPPNDIDSDSSSIGNFPSDAEDFEAENNFKHITNKTDNKAAVTNTTLDKNSASTTNYACNICEQNFERNTNYVWHMRTKHEVEVCSWNCQQCPDTFTSQKKLKSHVRKTHDPSNYPCPQCSRIFKMKKVFENHIKREHEGVGWLICEECGEKMRSEEGLIEHMAIHTGRGAYKCTECDKCFAKKSNFRMHMQTHGDKHICGECGAKLTTSKALKYHMKVHSDEMPYKCDYCGRKFKRTKNLKSHLITHTGLKPYSCDFCDKTFSTVTSCRYHKKHLHPKELAALEAAGIKAYTRNIPQIGVLRAITQAAAKTGEVDDGLRNKSTKLPKLDAELFEELEFQTQKVIVRQT